MEKRFTYAVLWGAEGAKGGFRKIKSARKFAKEKAIKIRKPVEIDKITSYYPPIASIVGSGRTDWSQGFYETVLPSGKRISKVI
jgi:hypothetical protein